MPLPSEAERFAGLVSLVASEGGEGMEFLARVLGGSRARLWLPTRGSAERVVAYCKASRWDARMMKSLEMGFHGLSEDGYQVTVGMKANNILDLVESARALPGAAVVLASVPQRELPRLSQDLPEIH